MEFEMAVKSQLSLTSINECNYKRGEFLAFNEFQCQHHDLESNEGSGTQPHHHIGVYMPLVLGH